MKLVTAIVEQVSAESLAQALPTRGVEVLTISDVQRFEGRPVTVEVYRGVRMPKYFSRSFRVEMLVDDFEVDRVVEAISAAGERGQFDTRTMWVSETAEVGRRLAAAV